MNPSLHMLRLEIDPEALIRFAQTQGLNHAHDEDLGYAVHAWLAACFGELAPKPFRVLNSHAPRLQLLAYSQHEGAALADRAARVAEPETRGVLGSRAIANALMPEHWRKQGQLDFEVLACPITRRHQTEKDVYLRRMETLPTDGPPPERGAVYREWLAAQLEGAALLDSFRLEGFHLVRVLRRTQSSEQCRTRSTPTLSRPRALCRGTLRIADEERFQGLLRRGIGRHRAFGYGMLLLRPSSV